jgi:hypothetical protein
MVSMVGVPLVCPVKFLPAMLSFQIYFFCRYHDYCVLTKITEIAVNQWEGCQKKQRKNFTREMSDFYLETIGFEVSEMLIRNLSTALVACSMVVSIYRMSKAYGFDFFPRDKWLFRVAVFISLLFIALEINIDLLWDSTLPECIEWTLVEDQG